MLIKNRAMTRTVGRLAWFFSLLLGAISSAFGADIQIRLTSPNAAPEAGTGAETLFAPTRDVKIVGTLTGADASGVKNMTFSLYKIDTDGHKTGDAVRTITTDLFTSGTGTGYGSRQNANYANLTMFDNKINFETTAIPELVYDAQDTATFNDPNNKGVLYTKNGTMVFSAILLGGATKQLDGGAGYGYADDLTQGVYRLEVTALDCDGNPLGEAAAETLTFGDIGRNLVFSRYTDALHMKNIQSVAREKDTDGNHYKIMIDPFTGYYTDSATNEFGEIQARWKSNDYLEYENAPKILGFIYDISGTCATRHEIGTILYQEHWNQTLDHQVYLYHYDIGDSTVTYRRQDGSLKTLEGALQLFNGSVNPNGADAASVLNDRYDQLALTRVELYDALDPSDGTKTNIDDLTFYNKQVEKTSNYSHQTGGETRPLVLVRPDQKIGVYGLVTPIRSTVTKVDTTGNIPETEGKGNLLYNIDQSISTVALTLTDENGQVTAVKETPVKLTRLNISEGAWPKESVYEFKETFEALQAEGTYTLSTLGYLDDTLLSHVERTNRSLDMAVTRTGILDGANLPFSDNQRAFADAFLDALIEGNAPNNTLADSYINTKRENASETLTALSGSVSASIASRLAFDPFTTVYNRLDDFNYRLLCATGGCATQNVWGNYLHHWLHVDATDEIDDFHVNGNGVIVGYDRRFYGGCIGAAYLYENSEAQVQQTRGELDDHTVMLYAKVNLTNQLWLTGMYGWSFRDYQTERFVHVGDFGGFYEGNFGGDGQWANVRLERPFCISDGMLTPFFGYQFSGEKIDGYQETGSAMAQRLAKRSENYGWLQAGARTNLQHERLALGLRLMYAARLDGKDRAEYTADFAGQDGYRYTYCGKASEQSDRFFDANLEARYQVGPQTDALLGYNGLYGNRSTGHTLSAGLNTSW